MTTSAGTDREAATPSARWAVTAVAFATLLVAASILVPKVAGWNVHEDGVHPLSAVWDPRFGPGTVPAVAIGVAALALGPALAVALPWWRLLALSWLASAGWLVSLATVDGQRGLAGVLGKSTEFLPTARSVGSISTLLHQFVSRIPFSAAPHNWPIDVAGHPPGTLLFFVILVRVGLGGNLAAGLVVVAIAATTPAAVGLTLRRLRAPAAARTVLPFLAIGPAAIWSAVSADAVFAAAAAWGLCLLAYAATSPSTRAVATWGVGAGVVLGLLPFLSYGLVLIAPLALAVAYLARSWRCVAWASAPFVAVAVGFAVAGFSWWRAYPVLSDRYWDGAAHLRPGAYWTWADLALLVISAGPALAVGVSVGVQRAAHVVRARAFGSDGERTVLVLAAAATLAVLAADVSQMSRAEVERIWLPFEPWLLVLLAFVPVAWRRWAFGAQVVCALVVQSLLFTRW